MHVISNIALISINETLFVELVSFLIFLFLINRIMFRPLRETMQARDAHILSLQDEIQQSENHLRDLNAKIRGDEVAAVQEARQQREALKEAGSRRADDIITEIKKEIAKHKAVVQEEVDQQIHRARQTLMDESQKLAVTIMERVLDRRMNSE